MHRVVGILLCTPVHVGTDGIVKLDSDCCNAMISKHRHLMIYETRELILVIGEKYNVKEYYKVLEIKRPSIQGEKIYAKEHTKTYSMEELHCFLVMLKANLLYEKCPCLFGMINLMKTHYLIIVTNATIIGTLNGSNIYTITDTALVPLTFKMRKTIDDDRYKSILQYMNLNKGFYFSYSYDLTNTLQTNHSKPETSDIKFIWNAHTLDLFISLFQETEVSSNLSNTLAPWLMFIVHGYIRQQTIRMQDFKTVHYMLISRRSQYFAGTRYLRRGVNDVGNVANEVETEQIITQISSNQCRRSSSVVQIRGSLPICWSHTNIFSPNPDIFIDTIQSLFSSTSAHFCDIRSRYGQRIHLLSLIRQSESNREILLGNYFRSVLNSLSSQSAEIEKETLIVKPTSNGYTSEDFVIAVSSATETMQVRTRYVCFDMLNQEHSNQNGSVFDILSDISKSVYPDTGFFLEADQLAKLNCDSSEESDHPPSKLQTGVLRTNCIDCLDRTNIAQFSYAKYVLHEQLKGLGMELSTSSLDSLHSVLMEIWVQNGDALAMQYAGSEAMHKVEEKKGGAFFNFPSSVVGNNSDVNSAVKEKKIVEDEIDVEYLDMGLEVSANQTNRRHQDRGETEFVMSGSTYKAVAAVRRYYSNILSDFERQRAMDLILGVYHSCVPHGKNGKHIWEWDQNPKAMRGIEFVPKFSHLIQVLNLKSPKSSITIQTSLTQSKAGLRERRKKKKVSNFRLAFHCDSFGEVGSYSSLQDMSETSFNRPVLDMLEYTPITSSVLRNNEPTPEIERNASNGTSRNEDSLYTFFQQYLLSFAGTACDDDRAFAGYFDFIQDGSNIVSYQKSVDLIASFCVPLSHSMEITTDLNNICDHNHSTAPESTSEHQAEPSERDSLDFNSTELTFFPVLHEEDNDERDELVRVEKQEGLGRLDVLSHVKALTNTFTSFGFQEFTSPSKVDKIEQLQTKHDGLQSSHKITTDPEKEKQENVFSFAAKWFNLN